MGLVDKLRDLDEYVWKQYEKVTRKLQPTPVPQLEPAKPTKYQTIDAVVGEID